jgi:hypothetical protein
MKKISEYFRFQWLHVFSDDYEMYVAFDQKDAIEVWKEFTGETDRDDSYDEFCQIPDLERVRIGFYPEDFEDFEKHKPLFSKIKLSKGGNPSISAPAWAWILINGRGFLSGHE